MTKWRLFTKSGVPAFELENVPSSVLMYFLNARYIC